MKRIKKIKRKIRVYKAGVLPGKYNYDSEYLQPAIELLLFKHWYKHPEDILKEKCELIALYNKFTHE